MTLGRDLSPRVEQVLEPTDSKALFAQPAVEAFHIGVLRRPARLNMHQLNFVLDGPSQEVTTGQLRAIITANRERSSALRNDLDLPPENSAS